MDVLITWDFEIRWLRNFPRFLMKVSFFFDAVMIYCAQMSKGVEPKIITPKNPLRVNETKRGQRDQCREGEEQTTRLKAAETSCFASSLSVEFESRSLQSRGWGATHTILKY